MSWYNHSRMDALIDAYDFTPPRILNPGGNMQPLIAQQPIVGMSLKDITSKTNKLPNRYGLHAVEGWGKTSLAAQFPKPIFIQTRGETGLETLIDAGRLPETPHFPEIMSWQSLREAIRLLGGGGHAHKTLVVDTLNGAQNLCFEDVCRRQFSNDRDKFVSFGRGPAVAAEEWRAFLQELDEVRQKQKMIIFCLVHTKVTKFKNPEGSDFDRYQPELDGSVWSLTHKWLDVVMFGNFLQMTGEDKSDKRQKGLGGIDRMLYCSRTAAWDAKNRIGLEPEYRIGNSPQEAYQQFSDAVKAGRGTAQPQDQGGN